jgi:hypothetical protein
VQLPDKHFLHSALRVGIAGLARSLAPGDVLLVPGGDRRAIPGDLRGSRQGGRLSTPSTCRQRGSPRPVRAEGTANCCGPDHLLPSKPQKRAPQAYSTVQDGLPKDVHLLDPRGYISPTFTCAPTNAKVKPRSAPVRIDGWYGRALDHGRLAAGISQPLCLTPVKRQKSDAQGRAVSSTQPSRKHVEPWGKRQIGQLGYCRRSLRSVALRTRYRDAFEADGCHLQRVQTERRKAG